MAETEIVGRVLSYPTIYGDAVWEGSDAPVQMRVASRRTTAAGSPGPYLRSQVDQIFYSVARKTNEVYEYVTDYVDLEILDTDAMPVDGSNPESWDFDAVGFNFSHVVPHGALDGPALHLILYTFILQDGTQIVQPVEIMVNAPCGMEADDGGDSGGGSSSTPTPVAYTFSQTQTVTVENTADATTLIGTGSGTNLIAADSQVVGKKHAIEAAGYFSTTSGDQSAVMTVHLGSEITLTLPTLYLLGGLTNERWKLRATFTCRTIGASGTVVVEAELNVGGVLYQVGTTTPQTIPTDAGKIPNLKIDWSTAHLSNSWKCQQYDLIPFGVAS